MQQPGAYDEDEQAGAGYLVQHHYDTLIEIARAKRWRSQLGDTMQTSDLLHESWLRLDKSRTWNSEEHFIRAATLAMRHAIIDYQRRKQAGKRGGGAVPVTLDEDRAFAEFSETPEQLLEIGMLMEKLEQTKPRWVRVVDARYFAGMTEDEAAASLGMSASTVRRDWTSAREWFGRKLGVEA